MKADSPGFSEAVYIRQAQDWLGKALLHIEQGMPGMAMIDILVALEKFSPIIRGLSSEECHDKCKRARRDTREWLALECAGCKHMNIHHKKRDDGTHECDQWELGCAPPLDQSVLIKCGCYGFREI